MFTNKLCMLAEQNDIYSYIQREDAILPLCSILKKKHIRRLQLRSHCHYLSIWRLPCNFTCLFGYVKIRKLSVFEVHAMQAMLFLWHFHRLILQATKNHPWFFMKLAIKIVMNLRQPVNLKDFLFEVECTYVILEATVSSCRLIFLKDSWSSIFAEKFDVTNLFFFPLLLKWKGNDL